MKGASSLPRKKTTSSRGKQRRTPTSFMKAEEAGRESHQRSLP